MPPGSERRPRRESNWCLATQPLGARAAGAPVAAVSAPSSSGSRCNSSQRYYSDRADCFSPLLIGESLQPGALMQKTIYLPFQSPPHRGVAVSELCGEIGDEDTVSVPSSSGSRRKLLGEMLRDAYSVSVPSSSGSRRKARAIRRVGESGGVSVPSSSGSRRKCGRKKPAPVLGSRGRFETTASERGWCAGREQGVSHGTLAGARG